MLVHQTYLVKDPKELTQLYRMDNGQFFLNEFAWINNCPGKRLKQITKKEALKKIGGG